MNEESDWNEKDEVTNQNQWDEITLPKTFTLKELQQTCLNIESANNTMLKADPNLGV